MKADKEHDEYLLSELTTIENDESQIVSGSYNFSQSIIPELISILLVSTSEPAFNLSKTLREVYHLDSIALAAFLSSGTPYAWLSTRNPNASFILTSQNRTQLFMNSDIIKVELYSNSPCDRKFNDAKILDKRCIGNETQLINSYLVAFDRHILDMMHHAYPSIYIPKHIIKLRNEDIPEDIFPFVGGVSQMTQISFDLLNTFRYSVINYRKQTIFLKDLETKNNIEFDGERSQRLRGIFSVPLYLKILQVVYNLGALLVLGFATSIYCKVITFLSPLLLYAISKVLLTSSLGSRAIRYKK